MLVRMWGKRNPYTYFDWMQTSAATIEISMVVPQKSKNRLAYDITIDLKNCKSIYNSDLFIPLFFAPLCLQ
jgi:hypothetical protein